jgi:hypothetical protein
VNFLTVLFQLALATFIPFILYSLTTCGKNFDPISFIYYGRTRIGFATILILMIAGAIAFDVETAKAICTPLGFNIENSSVGVGLALSTALIAGIRGDEDKKEEVKSEKIN